MDDATIEPGEEVAAAEVATPAQVPIYSPATFVRNAFFGLAARSFAVVGAVAAAVITIRSLSVGSYAQLASALALISIYASVSEAGITSLVAREIAQEPERTAPLLSRALAAETALCALAAALLVPTGVVLGYGPQTLAILAVGAAIVLGRGVLAAFDSAFLARRVFVYFAAYSAAQYVALVLGTVVAAAVEGAPVAFAAATAGSYAVAVAGAAIALRFGLRVRPRLRGAWHAIPSLLRAAAPIGVMGSAAAIYGRIDVLMLSKLGAHGAVAIYNVPLIMVEVFQVVPAALSTAFFPLLTAQLREAPDHARTTFDLLARLYLLISVPIALVLGVGGDDVIRFVFHDRYAASGLVVAILAATVVLAFFNYLLWYAMLATHRERGRTPAMFAGLVLNVALNAWLIPLDGPRGAATALVASDAFMVAYLLAVADRRTFPLDARRLLPRPLVAGAAATAVLVSPLRPSGFALACVAAGVYSVVLLASGYVPRAEWNPLTAPLRDLLGSAARRLRRHVT